MDSTLLISVGGAPAPVIFSIRQHRAERVIFFVSDASRAVVSSEILPSLLQDPGRLPDHEFVVTPGEQDLGESVFVLLREVPAALRRLGVRDLDWPDLVDYTAGTKTMSAALVLASSRHPSKVSYVGTVDPAGRDRYGLGVVIDGRERVFRQENPWNRIAWLEARAAAELFNRGQYGNAAALLRRVEARVDEEPSKRLYKVLGEVFEGFYRWDVFDHERAQSLLRKNQQALLDLAQNPQAQALIPNLKDFAERVGELADTLKNIKPRELSWDAIHDLLANALRRARLEQKYEDATARCYAAIEKIAQHALLYKYGIDAANARPEQLPAAVRADFVRTYHQTVTDKTGATHKVIRFGAMPALELLYELGDPIGQRFRKMEQTFRSHMNERNRSILGHGMNPIDERKFRALFEDALSLLDAKEEDLWDFPQLQI